MQHALCILKLTTHFIWYCIILNAILRFFPNFIYMAFTFDIDHRKKCILWYYLLKHQFNKRSMYFNLKVVSLIYHNKIACSYNNFYNVEHMYLSCVCKANVTKKFKIFDLKFVNPTPPLSMNKRRCNSSTSK